MYYAAQINMSNSVLRAVFINIVVFNIKNFIIHQLLNLFIQSVFESLKLKSLTHLQNCFRRCCFLIINEKFMIDLKTFHYIDQHFIRFMLDRMSSSRIFSFFFAMTLINFLQSAIEHCITFMSRFSLWKLWLICRHISLLIRSLFCLKSWNNKMRTLNLDSFVRSWMSCKMTSWVLRIETFF